MDNNMNEFIIKDLKNKVNSIVETSINLSNQGYIMNKSNYIKLDWSSILIHAFENMIVLNDKQKHNVELIYNKLSTI